MPLECFYTLPKNLEENRVVWRTDPELQENIRFLSENLDPLAEFNEEMLDTRVAQFLFQQLHLEPENELFRTHWIAFLEKRCEQVSRQILSVLPVHLRNNYFRDLFLMGSELVCNPANFFERFDERRSQLYWYPTLKRFADTRIKNLLMPNVRKITGLETLGRTNLGLVARSSRRQVKEALQRLGYQESQLDQYLLIWQCFQEVKTSLDLGVNNFELQHFERIVNRYSELQNEVSLPEIPQLNMNGAEVKQYLSRLGMAIRQLLDPPLDSLDSYSHLRSPDNPSLIDSIPDREKIDQEMNQTLVDFQNFITQLLQSFQTATEKQTLFLRYGLDLKQGQVGKELGDLPQYYISRSLKKTHDWILSQICNWVKENLQLEPCSTVINEIEGVLCEYYSNQIDRCFSQAMQLLENPSKELLRLFYITKFTPLEISEKIHKSDSEVKDLIESIRQWLSSNITEQIQSEINLVFSSKGIVRERILFLTENRLQTILQLHI
ncbi:hypothetical protein IQ264_28420 [Phormidium sp. LEGE 05292]|uniref:hypothetical protein n=1 Tax=[Phormidium] sp. LEGE 05292 TaxID=767427 RepID=UPI00187E8C68|nr:hypothetical protein [Phormidium sp. LEGE 05292]MBE9229335.1 hypothetical protein [Phormidium sp. LEGE 05292]